MNRDFSIIDVHDLLHAKIGTLVLAAMVLQFSGCGGDSPPRMVSFVGTVTLDGEPLPQAEVRFIPQLDVGSEYIATGVTNEDGRFTLSSGGLEGVCVGDHLVTVSEADVPAELLSEQAQAELAEYRSTLKNRPLPIEFNDPTTSGLSIKVEANTKQWNLDLVSD